MLTLLGIVPSDGRGGSYRFVCRISTDKRACVYRRPRRSSDAVLKL